MVSGQGEDKEPISSEKVRISYDDEFSASHFDLQINDPVVLASQQSRLLFYNNHLTDELSEVMEAAETLGCAPVPILIPLAWARISDDAYLAAVKSAAACVENVSEGSEDWLVLSVYMNAVSAAHCVSSEMPSAIMAEHMLIVGASLRELELVRRNKEHAARGRKTHKAASAGGAARRSSMSARTKSIIAKMEVLIASDHTVASAARIAASQGFGTSRTANEKLYQRHSK